MAAWAEDNGHNKPEYLKQRHGLPEELMKNISGIKVLVEKAVE